MGAWFHRARALVQLSACAALCAALLPACGLDINGSSDVGSDAGPSSDDATTGTDAANDGTGGGDAAASDGTAPGMDAPVTSDAPVVVDSATACANTPTSCGAPGQCVACTAVANGHACVVTTGGHACGCNGPGDCAAGTACNLGTHTCSSSCAGNLQCAGGCCDGITCQPGTDNAKCGQSGSACQPCGQMSPTCGTNGACNAACGGAGNGTCGGNSCCNAGTCAPIGDRSCGPPGQACVNCAGSAQGHKCELVNAVPTCGCGGPASASDCPVGMACRTNQCATSCDSQHPCNGGCCSGNTNGSCVAACMGGETCQTNVCQ